jgi:F-type H+-transporting ATPase subunit delta
MNKQKKIVTRRYAEAFCSVITGDRFEESFKDFEAFFACYMGVDDLRNILNHPTIHPNRKIEMIRRLLGTQASQSVVDFICLLIRRERIHMFTDIALEIERLYRRKHGIRGIIVKSAVPLVESERARLRDVLANKFGRVEIREKVDPEVIGGLVIQFGDQVIDDSTKARLQLLRELMIRVDNEWLMALINQPSLAL